MNIKEFYVLVDNEFKAIDISFINNEERLCEVSFHYNDGFFTAYFDVCHHTLRNSVEQLLTEFDIEFEKPFNGRCFNITINKNNFDRLVFSLKLLYPDLYLESFFKEFNKKGV